jgi:hypothetical protein
MELLITDHWLQSQYIKRNDLEFSQVTPTSLLLFKVKLWQITGRFILMLLE